MRTNPREFVIRNLHGRVTADFRFEPHSNIAPTQDVLVVPNTAARELTAMRWSLVPRFGHDPLSSRLSTYNARVETLATSNVFAPLLVSRRAIVLADGYYEWRKNNDGSKTPMWIHRRDGALLPLAALWDCRNRDGEPPLESVTIVTRESAPEFARIHNRMPAMLSIEDADAWLAPGRLEPRAALDLLEPNRARALTFHAVSPRVGNVRNDDESLMAPVPDTVPLTFKFE